MKHPLSDFGVTRIIYLELRRDRRGEMMEQLRRIGVPAYATDVAFFDAVRPADSGGFPTGGARGCFISHLGVLEQALKQRFGGEFAAKTAVRTIDMHIRESVAWPGS